MHGGSADDPATTCCKFLDDIDYYLSLTAAGSFDTDTNKMFAHLYGNGWAGQTAQTLPVDVCNTGAYSTTIVSFDFGREVMCSDKEGITQAPILAVYANRSITAKGCAFAAYHTAELQVD
jgi:hypothetical protein